MIHQTLVADPAFQELLALESLDGVDPIDTTERARNLLAGVLDPKVEIPRTELAVSLYMIVRGMTRDAAEVNDLLKKYLYMRPPNG